jgi:EAL domain-containing protein (putative c-di-GMP-specific phosphodiesterase class I)
MVKNIESNQADKSTVRYISELANDFDAELCVEGVENSQMRDILRDYKVKSLQGYYYSKPVPFDEFCALEI